MKFLLFIAQVALLAPSWWRRHGTCDQSDGSANTESVHPHVSGEMRPRVKNPGAIHSAVMRLVGIQLREGARKRLSHFLAMGTLTPGTSAASVTDHAPSMMS